VDTLKQLAALAFGATLAGAPNELPLQDIAAAERFLQALAAEGHAPARVHVRAPTAPEREIGIAMRVENNGACTLILGALLDGFLPAARREDPLVQEYVVLHELAHCQHARARQTFAASTLSPGRNAALHDAVVMNGHLLTVQLYREMYADVRALLVLLERYRYSAPARALAADVARWRAETAAQMLGEGKVHATAGAVQALLQEIAGDREVKPQAIEATALRLASDALLAMADDDAHIAEQIGGATRGAQPARYAIWLWSAACAAHPERNREFYSREAARLTLPLDSLLDMFARECSGSGTHSPERVRQAFQRAEAEIALRLAPR
jgi:hypothetical protein